MLARRHELTGHQRVVAEQVLDDPQVERARDVLRVLEPVLELAVARDVVGVVDVREQLDCLATSFSGPMAMKPLSMYSPLSTPPPAATRAS